MRGAIRASGCVTAIRFNGQRISRLSSDDRTVVDATWFTASGGLVERVNTLEIDVNGAVPSASEGGTMMWLRLWLTGIRLPAKYLRQSPATKQRTSRQREPNEFGPVQKQTPLGARAARHKAANEPGGAVLRKVDHDDSGARQRMRVGNRLNPA